MAHIHSVFDTDTHFVIDKDTREIKRETSASPVIVQHDHNSERFSFELPRYIDGHDMTLCNEVQVHYLNIDSSTKDPAKGVYTVDDIGVLEGDESKAACSWLISENATQHAGKLNFMIRFACIEGDGSVSYRWNTGIYTNLTVVSGYDNGEAVTEDFPDILAQWKADLFGIGDTEEQRIKDASNAEQAAIAAKGEAVRSSIPEEYKDLQAQADNNYSNKAGAIVLDAEGESIVLNDASEYPLQNLKVFGKSTQDGEPSPDNPVEIVSVENPVVTVGEQTLALPHTLHGIPVSSGGNYTDANGQQWICDEVDLARGVYVQRVGNITLTGEETHGILAETGGEMFIQLPSGREAMYTNDVVTCKCNYYPTVARQDTFNNGQTDGYVGSAVSSTHIRITDNVRFNGDHDALIVWVSEKYTDGNPVIFEYILANPIETALTAAEIEAFKALHSNKPNTTILNDAGAYMAVEYVADTKTYIDNKIAELMQN